MATSPLPSSPADPLAAVLAWGRSLPSPLDQAWSAFSTELGLERAGPGGGYFSHPMALPVGSVAAWVAHDLTSSPRQAAAAARQSALLGYLYVRIRDDALDDDQPAPPPRLLLSDLLLQEHLARLVAAGTPAVLPLAAERWAAFAAAMLIERETPPSGERFAALLDRSRPLLLPAAALLTRAGQVDQFALLDDVLTPIIRGHQLLNDLVDLERDAAAGRTTWLVHRAATSGRSPTGWLLQGGGLDATCEEILADLTRARAAADALGLVSAHGWLDARGALVSQVREDLWRAALTAVLRGG